jgi:tyrosyl-tRNA synthetase
MIKQGAVKMDGERVTDRTLMIEAGSNHIYQVGKRRFARVKLTEK